MITFKQILQEKLYAKDIKGNETHIEVVDVFGIGDSDDNVHRTVDAIVMSSPKGYKGGYTMSDSPSQVFEPTFFPDPEKAKTVAIEMAKAEAERQIMKHSEELVYDDDYDDDYDY